SRFGALAAIRNYRNLVRSQPREAFDCVVIPLAFPGLRKFVDLSGAIPFPAARLQPIHPDQGRSLRDNSDTVARDSQARVVFERHLFRDCQLAAVRPRFSFALEQLNPPSAGLPAYGAALAAVAFTKRHQGRGPRSIGPGQPLEVLVSA